MMPTARPRSTANETSRTAQNSCCRRSSSFGSRRTNSRRATEGIKSRRLVWTSPRSNFFQTWSKTTTVLLFTTSRPETIYDAVFPRWAQESNKRRAQPELRIARTCAWLPTVDGTHKTTRCEWQRPAVPRFEDRLTRPSPKASAPESDTRTPARELEEQADRRHEQASSRHVRPS